MAFFTFTVTETNAGQRVDAYLAQQLPQYSRAFLKKCRVEIGGVETKLSTKLKDGDEIQLAVPALKDIQILPENIPLEVIFEDDEILVLHKPAGMVVHPTDHGGHVTGTLVNALLHHLGWDKKEAPLTKGGASRSEAGGFRPGLVHRLDRDTSGIMVVAKTDAAKESLTRQFGEREVDKTYIALVAGGMHEPAGRIDAPIGRAAGDRTRRAISTGADARPAVSEFRVVESFAAPKPLTLLEVNILTGRTHQIRVHLKSIHHPIMGDTLYGTEKQVSLLGLKRQFLHAAELSFTHPTAGKQVTYQAPLPEDLERVLMHLRKQSQ